MSRTIQMKRGLLADLPQLLPGEFAFTIDTHEVFIGSAEGNVPMVNSDKIRELELDYETAAAALELTYAPELANLKASDTSINAQIAAFNQTIAAMNRGLGETMSSMAQLLSTYPTGDTKDHLVAGNIAEVDTLTVTTIPTTAGAVKVTLNGVAKTVPVTVGRAEVASLLVTAVPDTAGNVTVTLNGITQTVSINPAVETTTNLVAAKIRGTFFSGWVLSGTGSTVVFTSTTTGTKTDAVYSAGTTGATGTMSTTTQGIAEATTTIVAAAIRAATFTGWTTGGTGSVVTFTATEAGTRTAPTFSGGTTGAAATFARTVKGEEANYHRYFWNGTAWTDGGVDFFTQEYTEAIEAQVLADFTAAENARQADYAAAEAIRQAGYLQASDAAAANQELYEGLLEEGVLQTSINTKLAALELEYAPELTTLQQNDVTLSQQLADVEINAKYPIGTGLPGVVGDGVTDDWQALQNLINYCGENKFKLKIPSITCLVSKPLDGVSGITILGNGINNTKIKKSEASVNVRGVDTVFDFYQKNNFKISGIELAGNRKNYAEGNTVSTDGLTLLDCSYFEVENIRATSCKRGFYLEMNFCCSYARLTALLCQGYAFTVKNATTSTILSNCTSWGCGGLFDIEGCIYTTIISPACDHSDAGGRVDDPFLTEGSGGNYLNPSYIFNVSSSKITIISPGAENCYSQYMYCEGSDVTLINAYLYNFKNHADTYRFIELRGTGVSNLCITNPNFTAVSNERTADYTRCGFYIEDPNVQKIKTNKFMKLNDNFGDFEYPSSGIEYIHKTDILNLDQYSMRVGEDSFFVYDNVTAANTTIIEADVKKTKFTKLSATPYTDPVEFKVNLPKVGQLFIDLEGYYTSSYVVLSCDIIETDGTTTTVLKSFSVSADFKVNSYVYLNSTKKCYLRIKVSHSTDVLKFSKFAITQIM